MEIAPSQRYLLIAMLKIALLPLLAVVLAFAGPASAQTPPQSIGSFRDWTAYSWVKDGEKICYMISRPKSSEPKGANRGDIYIMVTHRQAAGAKEVVSHNTGYPYDSAVPVQVTVDGKSFQLTLISDETAWAADSTTDATIIDAMRRGAKMSVVGVSTRGTRTTDTYSLLGFSAAQGAIRQSCR
ncbi:invasion associated locus B family protein [Oceanibacterium hippocampi]|uniref:Invasion associated locus B (IalB) protein n=1 Tax=Oceanibacterium hippocampi TaxID=745714 RepID=A0A1Y5R9L1_9PROT|nr:invasion associated locus B family protein [Oceanibacterium hippocampi]SLN12321.1 hypothetical protein OCH7691_00147 [Oceanibacterium hippocampi]